MNAINIADLDYLDDEFMEAEEPVGFSKVPDGEYIASVFAARAAMSEDEQPIPRLEWEFIILEGEYADRHLFRNNILKDKQSCGWLKKDLRACGIDIDDPSFKLSEFLVNGVEQLLDVEINITVKNKKYIDKRTGEEKEACNVYINGLAVDDEPEDEVENSADDANFDFDEKFDEAQKEAPVQSVPRSSDTARRTTRTATAAGAGASRTSTARAGSGKSKNPFKD